jgi:hypothetical protein
MRATSVLLYWLRNTFDVDDPRLRRFDMIRGQRLALGSASESKVIHVFAGRRRPLL